MEHLSKIVTAIPMNLPRVCIMSLSTPSRHLTTSRDWWDDLSRGWEVDPWMLCTSAQGLNDITGASHVDCDGLAPSCDCHGRPVSWAMRTNAVPEPRGHVAKHHHNVASQDHPPRISEQIEVSSLTTTMVDITNRHIRDVASKTEMHNEPGGNDKNNVCLSSKSNLFDPRNNTKSS